jgi:menaquinone-specific isochorismate synthase
VTSGFAEIERHRGWCIGWRTARYRPRLADESFALNTDHQQWIGVGVAASVRADGKERLTEVRRRSEAHGLPEHVRWFGGVAFEHEAADGWSDFGAVRFVVPRWLHDGRQWIAVWRDGEPVPDPDELQPVCPGASSAHRVVREPRRRHESRVEAALGHLRRRTVSKVVLSRDTVVRGSFDRDDLLGRLPGQEPGSLRFAFVRRGRAFMGQTPELLVRRSGDRVETEALAGSAPLDDAEALLTRAKDREEHRWVVCAVLEGLREAGAEPEPCGEPQLRRLTRIAHLWTPIQARASDVHVLRLVRSLHPTPATGGCPPDAARTLLRELELRPRGWYCGAVGWFDGRGDGDFRVALRSAVVEPSELRIFVGGGIVAGSDPAAEWEETVLKERAVLAAFGIDAGSLEAEGVA